MNILNVTTITEWRGGDAQMYTIYNLLKDKTDLKQYILCPQKSVLEQYCMGDQASYFTYVKNRFKLMMCVKEIIKICKTKKIDLLHLHDSSALNAGLIAKLFLPKGTKLIFSRKRNNRIKDKFLNRFKYSHPYILKIISVSNAVQKIFDNIIKDKSKLLTIYDAIDVKKVVALKNTNILHKEFMLTNNTKIIGNIAGLDDQKDLFTFIDAAKKILEAKPTSTEIKFFIFGRGPKKDALQQYINENQLEKDVILAGFRTDVLAVLPEFEILLMTSIEEGLPLSIYEAFAAKIPVVSTDAGGIKEVVVLGETGFVAPQKDAAALSQMCLDVLLNPELKNKIVENAFKVVAARHDLKNFEENYYAFYKSL